MRARAKDGPSSSATSASRSSPPCAARWASPSSATSTSPPTVRSPATPAKRDSPGASSPDAPGQGRRRSPAAFSACACKSDLPGSPRNNDRTPPPGLNTPGNSCEVPLAARGRPATRLSKSSGSSSLPNPRMRVRGSPSATRQKPRERFLNRRRRARRARSRDGSSNCKAASAFNPGQRRRGLACSSQGATPVSPSRRSVAPSGPLLAESPAASL